MQRLSSVGKKKENIENTIEQPHKAIQLELNNEILFELYKSYCRKPPIQKFKSSNDIKATSKFHKTILQFDIPYVFDYSFNFYVNLKKIVISNSRSILLKSFSGLKLECIEFISVKGFEISEPDILSLKQLIFRNMAINHVSLGPVLQFFNPESFSLFNCQLQNKTDQSEYRAYHSLRSSNISSISCVDSFINLSSFVGLAREMNLKKFYFKNDCYLFRFNSLGPSFSYLIIKNIPLYFIPFVKNLYKCIDLLVVNSVEALLDTLRDNPMRLKYLICENIYIDSNIIKLLPPIVSISIAACSFENLAFYGFINKLSKSLRFLSLKDTQVPLDGIVFIKQKLSDCSVQINGNTPLYIPKSN